MEKLQLFKNNTTRNYIDGVAIHWYWNKFVPVSVVRKIHDSYPEKIILSTEACNGDKFYEDKVLLGSWKRGEDYAFDIIEV